jgi:hypothetical protein
MCLHLLWCFSTDPDWLYRNSAFGTEMFISDVAQYFPLGILTWLFEKDKKPGSVKIRENREQVHAVARTLVDAKRKNMRNGDQGKDILSLFSKPYTMLRG